MAYIRSIIFICATWLLAACGQTTAFEPQNRSVDARHARIYFIRQPTVLSGLGLPDIKINGKLVGSLAAGSYIVADRPPGPYTISIYAGLDEAGSHADIQVEPGMSYYFELGRVVKMNIDLLTLQSMGVTGRPLPGRYNNSPMMFYVLEGTAGPASIEKIKAAKS
jgi:hypothetical protein